MSGPPHRALTPENLLEDLGPGEPGTWELLRALMQALEAEPEVPRVQRCYANWRQLFSRCTDGVRGQHDPAAHGLGRVMQELSPGPRANAEQALFVLHSYYALVIKLLCVSLLGGAPRPSRRALQGLESGSAMQRLGVSNLCHRDDCFAWYLWAWSPRLQRALGALLSRLGRYVAAGREAGAAAGDPTTEQDLLRPLYLALVPRRVRHRLGEFYTPDWLARRVIELTMGDELGDPRRSVVDPACGSGTFLVQLIHQLRRRAGEQGLGQPQTLELILRNVVGQDLNPLAVLAARANYLLALGPLLAARPEPLQIPVRQGDSVLSPPRRESGFDYVVGNPPWINWQHLPDDYRRQTRPCWERLELFPHKGMDTILGKGKKDISMLLTCVALERSLRPGGRLGFLLPQGLLKTAGAGEGFRRFLLPGDVPFAPLLVEDLVALRPFEGASTRPLIVVFARDRQVQYPVPYRLWRRPGPAGGAHPLSWHAEPVELTRPQSPWLTTRPAALGALRKLLGPSPCYVAHEGANSGGANAVYWVTDHQPGAGHQDDATVMVRNVIRGARIKVPRVCAEVEAGRLFPLLRGRDVQRWQASPSLRIVMAQDPATRRGIPLEVMQRDSPATARYLSRFRKMLARRPAFLRYFRAGDAYWSMFNVGPFTFAPFKVVWREQASGFTAAVAAPHQGRPTVPDHKLMLVAAASEGEAHYLCASLNSAPVRLAVAAYAVPIQISTHILRNVAVPRYRSGDNLHRALVRISRQAHQAVQQGDDDRLARAESRLEMRTAQLWGLSQGDLDQIHQALAEHS